MIVFIGKLLCFEDSILATVEDSEIRNGMGQHVWTVTFHQLAQQNLVLRYSWSIHQHVQLTSDQTIFVSELHYPIVITTIKTSICLLYLRIFGTRTGFRKVLFTSEALIVAWCIDSVTAVIFQCRYGEVHLGLDIHNRCTNINAYLIGTSVINVILDFWVLVVPLPVVWTLHLSNERKIALSGILLVGIL